ncbi:MAG: 2-oxo-4-hydroxy-4-carboxy-5-ureidoimidazoline decarboxylase [Roseobacter sp.]
MLKTMTRLDMINDGDDDAATQLLEPLIERAPHIARRVTSHRPFKSVAALTESIILELRHLDRSECITLFQAHPELAPLDPLAMTNASQREQGRLDLTSLDTEHRAQLKQLNAAYRAKFGFPFITALVRHKNLDSVLVEFAERLSADEASEIKRALEEICVVSAERVQRIVSDNTSSTVAQA